MSSPFSKAFNAKSPVTPLQGNAFIKAKMDAEAAGKKTFVVDGKSHPVQMAGSPYHKHGKLEKKLKKAEAGKIGAEQGDKDYELIADLEAQIKQEKAKHSSKRTEEDDMQTREDEDAARGAAMEMAPLKKNASPLDMGGYVGGADVDGGNYVRTADAYQNMFNQLTNAANQAVSGMQDKEKNEEARLACEGTQTAPTGKKYKQVTNKDGKSNMECV